MITVASVDYCEQCRCKTWHVPLPSGERACEYHLPEAETGARAAFCRLCGRLACRCAQHEGART